MRSAIAFTAVAVPLVFRLRARAAAPVPQSLGKGHGAKQLKVKTGPKSVTGNAFETKGFGCKPYGVHAFLIGGMGAMWPKKWEQQPGLPALLDGLLKGVKSAGGLKCKLSGAEKDVAAGSADAEGDLLLFPAGLRLRGVGEANASSVVEALGTAAPALAANASADATAALSAALSALGVVLTHLARDEGVRAHVFACTHLLRDGRCGHRGTQLVHLFRQRAASGAVAVGASDGALTHVASRGCSHVGGHVFAGNLVVFAPHNIAATVTDNNAAAADDAIAGELVGDWYGLVSEAVAHEIYDKHLLQGSPLGSVWRGRCGESLESMATTSADLHAHNPCEACRTEMGDDNLQW